MKDPGKSLNNIRNEFIFIGLAFAASQAGSSRANETLAGIRN